MPLLAGTHGKAAGRYVLPNGRAAADIGAAADSDGGDKLRIAPDERTILDHGLLLFLAVVIARDRAGADVHLLADGGVAEIRQMAGLGARTENRFLQLDEITDVHALAELAFGADMLNGPT